MATLVGDRFLKTTGGWLDVVSGRAVSVRVGPAPADIDARRRYCAARFARLPARTAGLVDYGPVGRHAWFEAVALIGDDRVGNAAPPFSLCRLARRAVAELCAHAEAPGRSGVGQVQWHAPAGSGLDVAVDDLARALRAIGIVTIRADLTLPTPVRRQLCHRHLAVLVRSDRGREAAARWAAHLGAASNRSHLIIDCVAGEARADGAPVVRLEPVDTQALCDAYVPGATALEPGEVIDAARQSEGWPARFVDALLAAHDRLRAIEAPITRVAEKASAIPPSIGGSGPWPVSVSAPAGVPPAAVAASQRFITRAETSRRRGRIEAAGRWLTAGLEASRRHGDPDDALRTLERWVPELQGHRRWRQAAALADTALREAADPAVRRALARLAAAAHLEAGAVSRADACAETALCIHQLLREGSRTPALVTRAQVRFWQGRWREARAELDALPVDELREPALSTWRELLAWADGEDRRYATVEAAHAATDPWPWAVRVFRAATTAATSDLEQALAATSCSSAWRPVIEAQAWLEYGDEDAAARAIARAPVRPHATRGLADMAAASIRASLRLAADEERGWLKVVTSRERLRGVGRWGQGRSSMQMLQDMSKLLEIVQGCEDEASGLRRVCEWAQSSATATACAIISAPHGEVVTGPPLTTLGVARAHLLTWIDHPAPKLEETSVTAHARAPIRYGGTVIGLALGSAPAGRARVLFDAVQAVAAVSGSLLRARLDAQMAQARTDLLARDILGDSPAIAAVRQAAARAAQAPFPVVIEGESGTGKELVARALHQLGPRRDRAFAALNCAALTDELVEAELFGHARGAFTHAVNARAGLFEDAHHGTLFLDEVGDLSPRAQAKLLRVLQEGEIRRIGENESRAVDVRVIAATNRPLPSLVAAGGFRDDLMFRLSVVRIHVPPLRERAGDVPLLAGAFWREAARRVGTRAVLGSDALAALAGMPWPGNVRQLQNAMAALAVSAPAAGRVSARLVRHVLEGLSPTMSASDDADIVTLDEARVQVERRLVAAALVRHTGSRAAAATALGLSRQGLNKAMRRLGLAQAGVA